MGSTYRMGLMCSRATYVGPVANAKSISKARVCKAPNLDRMKTKCVTIRIEIGIVQKVEVLVAFKKEIQCIHDRLRQRRKYRLRLYSNAGCRPWSDCIVSRPWGDRLVCRPWGDRLAGGLAHWVTSPGGPSES